MIKEIIKKIRIVFLTTFKYNFKTVGLNFYCGRSLSIRPNTVTVGNNVFIGSYANLAVKELIIEDHVMLAPRVGIVGGDHRFDVVGTPIRASGRDKEKPVLIKKDAWIGYNSTIMQGVTIGEGSIVAACSLVTKDVEPYSIVGGSPAIFIRKRFSKEEDIFIHSKMINGEFSV